MLSPRLIFTLGGPDGGGAVLVFVGVLVGGGLTVITLARSRFPLICPMLTATQHGPTPMLGAIKTQAESVERAWMAAVWPVIRAPTTVYASPGPVWQLASTCASMDGAEDWPAVAVIAAVAVVKWAGVGVAACPVGAGGTVLWAGWAGVGVGLPPPMRILADAIMPAAPPVSRARTEMM